MPSILSENSGTAERLSGVVAIAILSFVAAAYLAILGLLMLLYSGSISMRLGAPLLEGLELAGPYMFLLMAVIGVLLGFGLLCQNRWARRAAIFTALLGLVMLVPDVSSAVVEYRMGKLAIAGLGVIVRVMIVWYLYQKPVKESFR